MNPYILLMLYQLGATGIQGGAVALSSTEFASKETCDNAALFARKEFGRNLYFVCVPK